MRASHYTTDTFYQHITLLSSDIGVFGSPKKDLGTSVATPRVLGIEQNGTSRAICPIGTSLFLRTSSPVQLSLGILFRNSGVSGQRPSHSLSLAGTAWLETSGARRRRR
jgi:hypothetical protein